MSAKSLLDVLYGKHAARRPIWFMRQAGRYLPEYRELRARAGSFLDLCYDPSLAAEITLQPVRRYDLDAAIVFADILLLPHAMGLDLKFVEGEGPVLGTVRSMQDVVALRHAAVSGRLNRVGDTLSAVRAALPNSVALIGFCGGPWTVASYMIEGGGSADRGRARRAAAEESSWFGGLMERLVTESIAYLRLQVDAGAEAVQIFDSWAGDIPGNLRAGVVFEPLKRICLGLREHCPDIPIIVFARGLGQAHSRVAAATMANAVGVEQGLDLARLYQDLPQRCALQGNLDPDLLIGAGESLDRAVDGIVRAIPMERHIFNLGHGVRQETDPAVLTRVIERVRAFDG